MGKLIRVGILVLAASLMNGCILQSKSAVYSDKDGVLVLGAKQQRIANYELSGTTWTKSKDTATFEPVGHHYKVFKGKNFGSVEFVALSDGKYVMQFDEGKGNFVYTVATLRGKELYISILLCDDLKKQNPPGVRFDKDDCFIQKNFGRAGFEALLKNMPAPKIKLVAE